MEFFTHLLDWASNSTLYLCILLFLTLLIEGTGMPGIPYEPVFLLAGYFIATQRIDFWEAVAVGTTGNLVGNLLGYWLGATPGRRLLSRWGLSIIDKLQNLEQLNRWLSRYGPAVIIISRWFGPIRTPTILGAGFLSMNLKMYVLMSAIGALTWTVAWQWGSWKLGDLAVAYWHYLTPELKVTVIVVAAIATILSVWYSLKYLQRQQA